MVTLVLPYVENGYLSEAPRGHDSPKVMHYEEHSLLVHISRRRTWSMSDALRVGMGRGSLSDVLGGTHSLYCLLRETWFTDW
jgi:hypothetical protein